MAFKVHIDNATQNQPGIVDNLNTAIISEGVVDFDGDDFLVEEDGTPNLSVNVNAGGAYVSNSGYTTPLFQQKVYPVSSNAIENVSINSNGSGNPRIDIICIKIDNSVSPGDEGINAGSVIAIAGTPAASPSVPATPARHYKLAEVAVANGSTTITNADITDTRERYTIQSSSFISDNNKGLLGKDSGGADRLLSKVNASNIAEYGDANLTGAAFYNNIRFSAYLSTNTDYSNGDVIVFDTEEYDPGSDYNTATGIYTVPVNGVYLFNVGVTLNTPTSGQRYGFVIVVNTGAGDVNRFIHIIDTNSTSDLYLNGSREFELSQGDLVKVDVFEGSSGTETVRGQSSASFFQGRLVALT